MLGYYRQRACDVFSIFIFEKFQEDYCSTIGENDVCGKRCNVIVHMKYVFYPERRLPIV